MSNFGRPITCLVGDSYKPSCATIAGNGDNPMYVRICSTPLKFKITKNDGL